MRDGFRDGASPLAFRQAAADLARCLRFSTRLPIPAFPRETDPHAAPGHRAMERMLPVAGALIGAGGAAILLGALALDFGPWLSATLGVATLTLVTGALHEDALADTADGFGGGTTPEGRLEIMKDSRIGSFGAAALVLAFLLRIAALAALADRLSLPALAGAMVFAGALSRAAALTVFRLPPARSGGLSYTVAKAADEATSNAWVVAVMIALGLAILTGLPLGGVAWGFGIAALVGFGMTRLAARLIGGHTGDVAGAVQQLGEIAALIGLLIAVPS